LTLIHAHQGKKEVVKLEIVLMYVKKTKFVIQKQADVKVKEKHRELAIVHLVHEEKKEALKRENVLMNANQIKYEIEKQDVVEIYKKKKSK
jgi:hypothetical protein